MVSERLAKIRAHAYIVIDILKEEQFKKFAEIGVWKSHFVKRTLRNVSDSLEEYWAVDPWVIMTHGTGTRNELKRTAEDWHNYHKYCCGLMIHFPQLKVLKMTSEDAASMFPNGYFDMVFIDAIHTFEHTYADIGYWLPKVRKGGLIGGHDYGSERHPGVKKAVDKWFGEENIKSWGIDEVWVKRIG
jgi:hypothetical protein